MTGVGDEKLDEWRRRVTPAVERLIRDQEYRDYRRGERDKRWKRWALWAAVGTGGLTIGGSIARTVLEGLRLLGLS